MVISWISIGFFLREVLWRKERSLTVLIIKENFILSFLSITIIFLILVLFLSVFSFAKRIQLLNDDFPRLANSNSESRETIQVSLIVLML